MRDKHGRFVKGSNPPILTEDGRRRISEANRGKKRTNEHKRKVSEANKGRITNWRGGKFRRKDGYIYVYVPKHPFAINGRYVAEHRLVIEEKLGRYLQKNEQVHHMNHITDDNRPENLMVLTGSEHNIIHNKGQNLVEWNKQNNLKVR